jgi:hypothetical protein
LGDAGDNGERPARAMAASATALGKVRYRFASELGRPLDNSLTK